MQTSISCRQTRRSHRTMNTIFNFRFSLKAVSVLKHAIFILILQGEKNGKRKPTISSNKLIVIPIHRN